MAAPADAWVSRVQFALAQIDEAALASHTRGSTDVDWVEMARSGVQEPTVDQYSRLAVYSGLSLAYLIGTESSASSLSIALRAGFVQPDPDVHIEVDRAQRLLANARLLFSWFADEAAELRAASAQARRARVGVWRADEAGRRSAENFRAFLGLGSSEPVSNVVAMIEGMGAPVERRHLPDDVHGMTSHDGADDQWLAVVFVTTRDYWTRQRFTLAHELAHLLYRDDRAVIVDRKSVPGTDLTEIRAEAFARHLLLPRTAVRDLLDRMRSEDDENVVAEIVLTFGISRDATLRALQQDAGWTRDRIAPLAYGTLSVRDLMNRVGRRDEWAAACEGQEEPLPSAMLMRFALEAHRSGVIPTRIAAEVLDESEDDTRALLDANGWGVAI